MQLHVLQILCLFKPSSWGLLRSHWHSHMSSPLSSNMHAIICMQPRVLSHTLLCSKKPQGAKLFRWKPKCLHFSPIVYEWHTCILLLMHTHELPLEFTFCLPPFDKHAPSQSLPNCKDSHSATLLKNWAFLLCSNQHIEAKLCKHQPSLLIANLMAASFDDHIICNLHVATPLSNFQSPNLNETTSRFLSQCNEIIRIRVCIFFS